MEYNNLLALDQASAISGWAYFENGNLLVDYGKFEAEGSVGERLVQIRNFVNEMIDKYHIDYIAFEDIQYQRNAPGDNVHTFKVLAEVYGVIEELAQERNIPYEVVSASSWKSTLEIKGKRRIEQKHNAQLYVLNAYGVKATQDTCDAICIGTHIIKQNEGISWS